MNASAPHVLRMLKQCLPTVLILLLDFLLLPPFGFILATATLVMRPFLHEAAHFLVARCMDLHPVAVQVGEGSSMVLPWVRLYGAKVVLGATALFGFGGQVSFDPPLSSKAAPGTLLLVACAGPASDFLLGVVVFRGALQHGMDAILSVMAAAPALGGIAANLWPWDSRSDGVVTCRALKHLLGKPPATAA